MSDEIMKNKGPVLALYAFTDGTIGSWSPLEVSDQQIKAAIMDMAKFCTNYITKETPAEIMAKIEEARK